MTDEDYDQQALDEIECIESGGHYYHPGTDVSGVDKYGRSRVSCPNCCAQYWRNTN